MEVRLSSPIVICVSESGRSMMAWSADEVHLTDDDVHVGIGATAREVLGRGTIESSSSWEPEQAKRSTLIGEHPTAAAAFAEIDRLASR